jgi:hypothetical protein
MLRESQGEKRMGIYLGLQYLEVASVGTKFLFFKGNRCAYILRRYVARRRKLGKAKKLDVIRKSTEGVNYPRILAFRRGECQMEVVNESSSSK